MKVVVFLLDGQPYALPLESVDRAIRAVEVTPLPSAPGSLLGLVDIHGQTVPVYNVRRRFRHPEREVDPGDQFLLVHTPARQSALVVDEVRGLADVAEQALTPVERILSGIEGVAQTGEGIILIHDLERFLTQDEEQAMEEAMTP